MPQIIFYEDKNFQGRSYECSGDCADIHAHLKRCNSCRIENGCFVVYDRPNFVGNQDFLRRGEYNGVRYTGNVPGMMGMGMMDTIRSCRAVPTVGRLNRSPARLDRPSEVVLSGLCFLLQQRGPFRMRIHERENFEGQTHELSEDCESLQDQFNMSDCLSCSVLDGHWLLFEQPGFRGRLMYVKPGEYGNLQETGMSNVTRVSSIRRIVDVC